MDDLIRVPKAWRLWWIRKGLSYRNGPHNAYTDFMYQWAERVTREHTEFVEEGVEFY